MDETLTEILSDPREGIAVELKRWLDLDDRKDVAKFIRACAALFNSNGGYLVIGVNDDGRPHRDGVPPDWESLFGSETLQQIVANNLAPSFEVAVVHTVTNDSPCVVIKVPTGAISPVCLRKDVKGRDEEVLLNRNDVYCRTLSANGKYSSARPSSEDWAQIMRTCLDNREADIARFLTRNFSKQRVAELTRQLVKLRGESEMEDFAASAMQFPDLKGDESTLGCESDEHLDIADEPTGVQPAREHYLKELPSLRDAGEGFSLVDSLQPPAGSPAARACREGGYRYFARAVEQSAIESPPHGSWEVAAVINGNLEESAPTREFLDRIMSANPTYTYAPFWTVGRGSTATLGKPYVLDNGWQSLIYAPPAALNFWRADIRGFFYLYRALEDDMSLSSQRPEPLTTLDFTLQIIRMTDVMAVMLAIAAALPMRQRAQSIEFLFQWRGLAGRELASWANINRSLIPGMRARQDDFAISIAVPTDATNVAVAGYVYEVTRQLFALFDGMVFTLEVVDDIARGVFERRL